MGVSQDSMMTVWGTVYFQQFYLFEYRIANLTQEEGAVAVNTYLTNLYTLEQAIITAAATNLTDNQLASVTRNPNEIGERTALLENWRRRLCSFIGIDPGPGVSRARFGGR